MSNQDNYVFIVLNIIAMYYSAEELLGGRPLVSHFDHRSPPPPPNSQKCTLSHCRQHRKTWMCMFFLLYMSQLRLGLHLLINETKYRNFEFQLKESSSYDFNIYLQIDIGERIAANHDGSTVIIEEPPNIKQNLFTMWSIYI